MSYIISKNNPFVNTKLTEKGRMKLAKGQLNFRFWAVGDSEINYGFEEIRDANPDDLTLNGKSILFRPKENQANIKYFISKTGDTSPLNNLLDADVKVIKALISNKAPERGFFSLGQPIKEAPYVAYHTDFGNKIPHFGTVSNTLFNGGDIITLPPYVKVGNLILFRFENGTRLWYKIQGKNGDVYTLDRNLPTSATETQVEFIEYVGGNIYDNGMANDSETPYWDINTLSFDNGSNVTTQDVQFWNMNNIWSQNIIGLNTATAEEFYKYGSNDMIGTRSPFLCYVDTIAPNNIQLEDVCVDASALITGSTLDEDNRAISVIHYTNNEISNLYGEFLYVDATGKGVEIEIPDMMYHRRKFVGGSGTGDAIGMTFKTDGSQKHTIKNSSIEYYDLIEHPDMVNGDPKVVGKVLPNYHTIVFDNEEIVAALSYKSGRNWTLPELKLTLSNPVGAAGTGLLAQGESIYVTYVLENSGNGLPYSLPCQKYAKIKNTNIGTKDVSFTINAIDELPYMNKVEDGQGIGFSAKVFKVLYQIVQGDEKPKSNSWIEYAIPESTELNGAAGQTLNPTALETQTFKLTKGISSTIYVINDLLNLPNNVEPDNLQFGDERFFYGNIRTDIGATIYKTVFDIKVSANEFHYTTNPTRTIDESLGAPEIRVSEVGIYDNERNLVFIGKVSSPIKLINGNSVTIELSMDF